MLALVAGLCLACTPTAPTAPTAPRACNGHTALCDRTFDAVSFAGAHNAMSSIHAGFAAPNQREGLGEQLALGVRAFLIDSYSEPDGLYLCHGSCLLGKIPLVDALGVFRDFLDTHPDEVLQLMIEDYATPAELEGAMTAAGLIDELIVHAPADPWPTLGALMDARTRILVTAEHSGAPPPWNQPMFATFMDTPFTFHSQSELDDPASCDLNRGSEASPLLLVNHWVGDPIPDEVAATQVNARAVLLARAQRCATARQRFPNVVAVDYVGDGDLFAVVDALNGF